MSKEVLVIVLGILTGLSPFMGLPSDLRTVVIVTLSLFTVIVGFFLRSEALSRGGGKGENFFVDNRTSTPSPTVHESMDTPTRVQ